MGSQGQLSLRLALYGATYLGKERAEEAEGADPVLRATQEHFRAWLGDPAGRDQIILFRDESAEVVWNGRGGTFESAYQKDVRRAVGFFSLPQRRS